MQDPSLGPLLGMTRQELIEVVGKLGKIIDYLTAYNRYKHPPRAIIEVVRVEKK
jgi:hypothetical protein